VVASWFLAHQRAARSLAGPIGATVSSHAAARTNGFPVVAVGFGLLRGPQVITTVEPGVVFNPYLV
jgi:hypothetical protein